MDKESGSGFCFEREVIEFGPRLEVEFQIHFLAGLPFVIVGLL